MGGPKTNLSFKPLKSMNNVDLDNKAIKVCGTSFSKSIRTLFKQNISQYSWSVDQWIHS